MFLSQCLAYSGPWEFGSQPVTLLMTASERHTPGPPFLGAVYVALEQGCVATWLERWGILKGLPERIEKEMVYYEHSH